MTWQSDPRAGGARRGRLRDAGIVVLFALLLVGLQYRSGAYRADLDSDPDEPAHAVTSLVVRDYLAQGLGRNPVAFTREFYAHYPKVAIGHWPPVFYAMEGAWMLVAGRNRVAMLLLVAMSGAALLSSVFFAVRKRASTAAALLSVAALVGAQNFQELVCSVRPDPLLAVMIFWGAVYAGRFVRFGGVRNRNIYLLFTAMGMLVHPRAVVLVMLPFCLLGLRARGQRWSWKWGVAAVGVVAVFLVPAWFGRAAVVGNGPWIMARYADGLGLEAGWFMVVLAGNGLLRMVREREDREFWAAMAGLVFCGVWLYVLVPVGWDERWLAGILPALVALGGGGFAWMQAETRGRWAAVARGVPVVVMAAAVVWLAVSVVRPMQRQTWGYRRAIARGLLDAHAVVLAGGHPKVEGGLIVEASLADRERTHTVLRVSKVLASSTWGGNHYRLLRSSPADVLRLLDEQKVSLVVVDAVGGTPASWQLREAMTEGAAAWKREPAEIFGVVVYERVR